MKTITERQRKHLLAISRARGLPRLEQWLKPGASEIPESPEEARKMRGVGPATVAQMIECGWFPDDAEVLRNQNQDLKRDAITAKAKLLTREAELNTANALLHEIRILVGVHVCEPFTNVVSKVRYLVRAKVDPAPIEDGCEEDPTEAGRPADWIG